MKTIFPQSKKGDEPDLRFEIKNKQNALQKMQNNFAVKESGNFWKKQPLVGKSVQLFCYSSCVVNSTMWLYGGLDWSFDLKENNNLIKVSLVDFSWVYISGKNAPPHRSGHTAVPYMDGFIIHGGQNGNAILLDSWRFFPATSRWEEIIYITPKTSCTEHSAVIYGSSMYVWGGRSSSRTHTTNLHVLKIETGVWKTIESRGDTLPKDISGHTAHVYTNKMFVFGGVVEGEAQNDVFCFNFDTQFWNTLDCSGDIPHPRYLHSSLIFDHMLWVFSGMKAKNELGGNELYCLDFGMEKWKRVITHGETPLARSQYSVVTHRNSLFLYGGWGGKIVLDDFQELKVEHHGIIDGLYDKCVDDVYTDVLITYRDTSSIRFSQSGISDMLMSKSRRRPTLSRRELGLNRYSMLQFRIQVDDVLDFLYFAKQNVVSDVHFRYIDYAALPPPGTPVGAPDERINDMSVIEPLIKVDSPKDSQPLLQKSPILDISRKSKVSLIPIRALSSAHLHGAPIENSVPGVPKYKNVVVRKSVTSPSPTTLTENDSTIISPPTIPSEKKEDK